MKEALEIINELLKHIDWLGGDAYEVEAGQSLVNEARDFLDSNGFKDNEQSSNSIDFNIKGNWTGVYIDIENPTHEIAAVCKSHAKNLLGKIPLERIKCIKQPK